VPVTDALGPVFIGGPDRCGKTLVAAILGSHPRIAISAVGSNLWPLFYRQYGELSDDANAERCISALLNYKHVRFMEPDPDALRREFRSGERTYARLFALIQEHHARRLGKVRWGDQTGLVERYADDIFRVYPGVRFIHMVRDPRDRYEASLQMWPEGRLRAGGAAGRWLLSTGLAARNEQRYRGRYLVLRYETLVTEPEATARLLCEFIGEEYEPSILELRGMPGYRAKLEASSRADPAARGLISRAFIGAYRGRIPSGELAFMQDVARRRMAEYGYVADPIEMGRAQRWRYRLAERPLNLVRMGAWRMREAAAHRFPRLLGRRPRPGMVV
jgi:hypothetical protein